MEVIGRDDHGIHRTTEMPCPYCGAMFSGHMNATNDPTDWEPPAEEAILVCAYCCSPSIIDGGAPRRLTRDEMMGLLEEGEIWSIVIRAVVTRSVIESGEPVVRWVRNFNAEPS